jgi:glycosyltransferase involved in cell wall biosynthesis
MRAPVLSTRIPSLERYGEAIEWVDEGDGQSYARALDELANQVRYQEIRDFRQQAVSRDSWSIRVNQFREIMWEAMPQDK